MNLTISQKGLVLVLLPLLFQLAFVLLVVRLQREYAAAQYWAAHSQEVIARAREIQADLAEAQAAARGFALTRDAAFAEPYDRADRELPARLDRLNELVGDNPDQAARAAAIRADAATLLGWQREVVRLVRDGAGDEGAGRIKSGRGLRLMNDLRRDIGALLAEEERLNRERSDALDRSRGRLNALFVAGGVVAVGGTLLLALVFHRGISRRFVALTANSRRLAEGEDLPPPLRGDDEIARLDRAFRDMAAELRRAADRVRDLYDNAPCGYHSVDPDGTLVAVNRTELRWVGYRADEVVGRLRFADFVSPASRETYRATFARVKEYGAAADVEIELVRKDGTTFPVLLNSSAVRDAGGRYLHSRTTLTDITERKRAEAATRLFADVVKNSPVGLLVYQLDPAGDPPALRVRSWNPVASSLLGIPLDLAVGRVITDVFPAVTEPLVRRFAGVVESGRADDLGEFEYGDTRVARRWWAVHAFPLPDRSVGVAFQDVTERKRAEAEVRRLNEELESRVRERTSELATTNEGLRREVAERARADVALRLSEYRYRSLVTASAQVVWITNPAGELVGDAPDWQAYTGQTAAEARGFGWTTAVHPDDRDRVDAAWRAATASRGTYEVEYRLRIHDGSWRDILARGVPILEPDGTIREWVGTCTDVTGRKRAEAEVRQRTAELEAANRDLAQKNAENEMFVYSVSHDLRSPLVNLQGFSKELEKASGQLAALLGDESVPPTVRDRGRALLDGKMAKAVGFIQTAVLRLSGIIDALLRLSRAGRVEYRWEVVDVAGVVGRVVTAAQATIAEKAAAVRVGDLPPAWGDATALEQVFGNLVGNALNYLDPARPGAVEVGSLPPGADGTRTYYVKDNGLGIPEGHRARIFQAFQRAHPHVGKGEGLGLAIVARVVERHRGKVWVESVAGEGSTFFVALPAPGQPAR